MSPRKPDIRHLDFALIDVADALEGCRDPEGEFTDLLKRLDHAAGADEKEKVEALRAAHAEVKGYVDVEEVGEQEGREVPNWAGRLQQTIERAFEDAGVKL